MKDKNHTVSMQEKHFTDFNIHLRYLKKLKFPLHPVCYLNIVKAVYDRPTTNIIMNSRKLKAFPLRSRTR